MRVLFIVINQLAGHWEKSVKIEGMEFLPVNIAGYHKLSLIPKFSYLMLIFLDSISHCPSCQKINPHRYSSKHSYLLFLDELMGEVINFSSALWI